MRKALTIVLLALLQAGHGETARAAELELDPSYGTGGITTLTGEDALAGSAWGYIGLPAATYVLADGSALFAGVLVAGLPTGGPTRLLKVGTDGRLDASFGRGGRVELPFGTASNGTSPAIVVDAGGRILVGGAAPPGKDAGGADLPPRARVVRVTPDGVLDARFGTGGVADQAIDRAEGPPRAVRLALDSQQRIRVVASCDAIARDSPRPCTVQSWRLLPDGRGDASFAVSGIPGPGGATPNAVVSFPLAVASVDGDASYVLLEEPEDSMDDWQRLVRIGADGRFDADFQGGVAGNRIRAILGAGRALYVSRMAFDQRTAGNAASLLRLDAAGRFDPGFGSNGALALENLPPGSTSAAYLTALALDDSDGLLAGGALFSPLQSAPGTLFTRVAPLGAAALDRSFGRNGFYRVALGTLAFSGMQLRRDRAGRLVVSGYGGTALVDGVPVVARLTTAGATPASASPGVISFGDAPVDVSEAAGVVRVRVIRAGGARGAASVDYAVSGIGSQGAIEGSDFRATRGRLDWSDGDFGDRFIEVAIIDDAAQEARESLQVQLANVVGAGLAVRSTLSFVIVDNDAVAPATGTAVGTTNSAGGASTVTGGGGGSPDGLLLLGLAAWAATRMRHFSGAPRRCARQG